MVSIMSLPGGALQLLNLLSSCRSSQILSPPHLPSCPQLSEPVGGDCSFLGPTVKGKLSQACVRPVWPCRPRLTRVCHCLSIISIHTHPCGRCHYCIQTSRRSRARFPSQMLLCAFLLGRETQEGSGLSEVRRKTSLRDTPHGFSTWKPNEIILASKLFSALAKKLLNPCMDF